MKLEKIIVYKYALPLVTPLKMKGTEQSFRHGLIIEVRGQNNMKGFGDAVPFPGLHKESLQDIIKEAIALLPKIKQTSIQSLDDIYLALADLPSFSPSLIFGLESAFFDLIAKNRKINPTNFFNPNPKSKIALNALLAGSTEEVLKKANHLKNRGYESVKLKVATRNLAEDIKLVLALDKIFKGKINIRLDANQSWHFEDAAKFGKAVRSATIEYIEEPCDSPVLFKDFYFETGLNYAFDETLVQPVFSEIKNFAGLKALILKPSVVGSLPKIKKWTDWAHQRNLKAVFSSAFESGIGLRAIACLAAAFGSSETAHGLDTFHWLKEDITIPPFTTQDAFLEMETPGFILDKHKLEKIYAHNF